MLARSLSSFNEGNSVFRVFGLSGFATLKSLLSRSNEPVTRSGFRFFNKKKSVVPVTPRQTDPAIPIPKPIHSKRGLSDREYIFELVEEMLEFNCLELINVVEGEEGKILKFVLVELLAELVVELLVVEQELVLLNKQYTSMI